MLDEFQRRNYAQNTVKTYIKAIEDLPVLRQLARA